MILLHELPDGASHFDWLIQRAGGPEASLRSFRVSVHPHDSSVPRFPAQEIPDHRPLYLDYEGELAGNRGRVSRVATGSCLVLCETTDEFALVLRIGDAERRLFARRAEAPIWWFGGVPAGAGGPGESRALGAPPSAR